MIHWEVLGDMSLIEFLWKGFLVQFFPFWVPPLILALILFSPIHLLLKFLGIYEIFGLTL
jgi:hypothetical protein